MNESAVSRLLYTVRALDRTLENLGHPRDTEGRIAAHIADETTRYQVWRAESLAWAFEQLIKGEHKLALRGCLQAFEYHGHCGGFAPPVVSDALINLRNALETHCSGGR